MGVALQDLPLPRPHRRSGAARTGTARHGVRRQRRAHRRGRGGARALQVRRTRSRIQGLRRVDARARIPRRAHSTRQRGAGRPAAGRGNGIGRSRFSHRRPSACRDRRGAADARDLPGVGRPTLLSPRHGTRGARRQDHRLLPARVQRGRSAATARAVPRRDHRRQRRRLCARAERSLRRSPRRSSLRSNRFRRPAARRRFPADRRRPVRTAQGRRFDQVLHAGGTPVTIMDSETRVSTETAAAIALEKDHTAHNYSPLPVVAASAEGAWITDTEGRRYLYCLSAYSAVNFGHRHPEITETAHAQLDTVTLVSRAFHSATLGPFCAALAGLCGKDMVLPMNSGAEAVESGLKVARKWGADVKGVAAVGGLLEPIQGEAGIVVPPDDYLPTVRALCSEHNVLMIADEIQSGLARTGRTFACEHWGVVPDIYLLGKALA